MGTVGQVAATVGGVAEEGIRTVGDVAEAILAPRVPAQTMFVPDRLDLAQALTRPLTSQERAFILKMTRIQNRHEKALLKIQARTNIQAQALANPMFYITVGGFSAVALFIYIVHAANRGEVWAKSVLTYIPNPADLIDKVVPDISGGLSWMGRGVEWIAGQLSAGVGALMPSNIAGSLGGKMAPFPGR